MKPSMRPPATSLRASINSCGPPKLRSKVSWYGRSQRCSIESGTHTAQRRHVDRALARPVDLAEEDPLVAAELELALRERDEHLGAHERRTHVRRRIWAVCVLVAPAPAVLDDLLHRGLDIASEIRVEP